MIGDLFQLQDVDGEVLGIVHYQQLMGVSIINELDMVNQWNNYLNSPDSDGDIDGFVDYLNDKYGKYFERVFLKDIFI